MMHDVNYPRLEAGSAMAAAQTKHEKEGDDCSLLPLVHDIIKWWDYWQVHERYVFIGGTVAAALRVVNNRFSGDAKLVVSWS